jgi:hypothetical protein
LEWEWEWWWRGAGERKQQQQQQQQQDVLSTHLEIAHLPVEDAPHLLLHAVPAGVLVVLGRVELGHLPAPLGHVVGLGVRVFGVLLALDVHLPAPLLRDVLRHRLRVEHPRVVAREPPLVGVLLLHVRLARVLARVPQRLGPCAQVVLALLGRLRPVVHLLPPRPHLLRVQGRHRPPPVVELVLLLPHQPRLALLAPPLLDLLRRRHLPQRPVHDHPVLLVVRHLVLHHLRALAPVRHLVRGAARPGGGRWG